jgi:serine/threonine protein kinase
MSMPRFRLFSPINPRLLNPARSKSYLKNKVELTDCSRCKKPLPATTREKLGGLCLECISSFVLSKDEETLSGEPGMPGAPGSPAGESLPLEIGTTFQGLQVLSLIARGGMGVVYRARQPDLDRIVALKILSPELAADPEFAQRFNGEAKVLALLSHPNIVQVYDFGRAADLYYLVMEYVEGVSLRQVLQGKRPGSDEILRILSQICTALEYAHIQGVVHRDIKPENILIGTGGLVKIADFGLAKIMRREGQSGPVTQTRQVMGTPQYMAPEQSENLPGLDHRADIYALGVILYEMLTGLPPRGMFQPPSQSAQVDRRLDGIVKKALERVPEHRYQRASELKTDIDRVASSPQGHALLGKVPRKVLFIAAALLVILGAGLAGKTFLDRPRQVARPLSQARRAVSSWHLENPGPGTRIEGEEVILTPNPDPHQRLSEAVPQESKLEKKFHLHFRFRYRIEPGQEPWLFLVMEASPESTHERNAIVIFPEAGHTIHFASRVVGKGWGMRNWQSLPAGAHGPDQWLEVDATWADPEKRLRVAIGGDEVFNEQLGPRDTLHGLWQVGLGGTATELRIRDVWVVNGP